MKILSVTVMIPQNDAQWTRISNIAKFLDNKGLKVSLVHYLVKGSLSHKKSKEMQQRSVTIISNPITLFFKHLSILKKGNYDLVYGNTFAGTFFCILGKLIKKPLVLDMHGISEEFIIMKSPLMIQITMKLMEKLALIFSDKILCVSHEMINYLNTEKNVPLKKLFYIPNGVDLDFFNQINDNKVYKMKKNYKIEDKLVFGYLGSNQEWQGLENFILASKQIYNKRFASIVVGCDIPSIFHDNNVLYVPFVKKDEIVKYYSLCDVLVLPRPKHIVTEVAAPTKFAEYTAMGKPVLITDVGDAAKLVKKYDNGLIVENNNVEYLKKGIDDFLKLGEGTIKKMGINSRKLAENEFDWNKIVNNLIDIIMI